MKKYLKKIEMAGIAMLFLGTVVGHLVRMDIGGICAGIGLLLWVFTVVLKAINWNEYRRDNNVNIFIMLGAIIAIFYTLIRLR